MEGKYLMKRKNHAKEIGRTILRLTQGQELFWFQPDRMESLHTRQRVELLEGYILSDKAKLV